MNGMCRLLVVGLIFSACIACSSKKEENVSNRKEAGNTGSARDGEKLFLTCKTCHGEAGQGSAALHAPALANLDGPYLYRQLMNFKNGLRGYLPADTLGVQMTAMAAILKDSVAVHNVVAYIETLPDAVVASTSKGNSKKGERTYQSICGSCHGPNGKGNEAMHAPRLNGLQDWYLKGQIGDFKNRIRGAHTGDQYGGEMILMADLLKDEESVDDVIAYILLTTAPAQQ